MPVFHVYFWREDAVEIFLAAPDRAAAEDAVREQLREGFDDWWLDDPPWEGRVLLEAPDAKADHGLDEAGCIRNIRDFEEESI